MLYFINNICVSDATPSRRMGRHSLMRASACRPSDASTKDETMECWASPAPPSFVGLSRELPCITNHFGMEQCTRKCSSFLRIGRLSTLPPRAGVCARMGGRSEK